MWGVPFPGLDFVETEQEYCIHSYYEWDEEYLERVFAAACEIVEELGTGRDGWRGVRWGAYDKVHLPNPPPATSYSLTERRASFAVLPVAYFWILVRPRGESVARQRNRLAGLQAPFEQGAARTYTEYGRVRVQQAPPIAWALSP